MKIKTLHELHLEAIEKDLFANNRLTTTDFAASKSAEITEKIAIEFFNFGLHYYANLKNPSIDDKELFQEFLKTRV
jgi:hypothetical protein